MWQKLKHGWAILPSPVQAILTTAAGGLIGAIGHAISEGGCLSATCLKHYAITAVGTAATALYAFYMQPNRGQAPPAPPASKS
jgi:hypothetical protein